MRLRVASEEGRIRFPESCSTLAHPSWLPRFLQPFPTPVQVPVQHDPLPHLALFLRGAYIIPATFPSLFILAYVHTSTSFLSPIGHIPRYCFGFLRAASPLITAAVFGCVSDYATLALSTISNTPMASEDNPLLCRRLES